VRRLYPAYYLLETAAGGGSQLYNWARDLGRGAQEKAKPSAERLPEYGEARLPQVEQALFAERPVYPAVDEIQLAWWLSKTREILTVGRSAHPPAAGQRVARRPGAAAHGRHQAGRSGVRPAFVGRRSGGSAGVGRSADPVPAARPGADPRRPQ
jgi:hypothetical protein